MSEEPGRNSKYDTMSSSPRREETAVIKKGLTAENPGTNFYYVSNLEDIISQLDGPESENLETTLFSAKPSEEEDEESENCERTRKEFICGVYIHPARGFNDEKSRAYLLGRYEVEDKVCNQEVERHESFPERLDPEDIEQELGVDEIEWLHPEDIESEIEPGGVSGNSEEALKEFFPNYDWEF